MERMDIYVGGGENGEGRERIGGMRWGERKG